MAQVPASSHGALAPAVLESDSYPQLVVNGPGLVRGEVKVTHDGGSENIDLTAGGGGQASGFLTGASAQVFRQDDALGSNFVGISKNGVEIGVHAAIDSLDMFPGQCVLWFDQTDGVGNTKLMVKGQSADGTVKTATILLA